MKAKKSSTVTARKVPGRPFKKGVSGNPKGRPMKGNTYAEIIREIGNMTGNQLADVLPLWAKDCRMLGPVRFKDALVAKMYLASMNEPTGAMCKVLLDRHDGLLPQPVAVGGDVNAGPIRITVRYVDGVGGPEAEPAPDAAASQE